MDELIALVVAEYERIEVLRCRRVAANDKLLTSVDAHLEPCSGAIARLVGAMDTLSDQAFQFLLSHGFDQIVQTAIQSGRVPDWFSQLWEDFRAE